MRLQSYDMASFFPDPHQTPHDEILTAQVRSDLAFLPAAYYVWVDEDARIFIDSIGPLLPELRTAVEEAGYQVASQPTIGAGRVQYKLVKAA